MSLKEKAQETLDAAAREEWLTVKEFAALRRVHEQTVYSAIRRGMLKFPVRRITEGGRIEILIDAQGYQAPPRPNLIGVYFLQCGPFIKIGMSADVQKRVHCLSQAFPYDLEPLGFISAESPNHAVEIEKAWHHRYSGHRCRPEWFKETPELLAAISKEAQPWPVSRGSINRLTA